ncbi:MAG: aminotransferase class III-fold pyridoxal phosphate-dependent enzyme, partial [Phycisphaeraceae bacterium]
MSTTEKTLTQQIIDRRDRSMCINYPRYPIAMVRGEGCHLYDARGRQYLDLFAGFGAGLLGHCHRDLVRAATEQVNKLWHTGNLFHSEPQTLLAERIARCGFGGRSFFCHSGADANEAAFKLSRLYGKARPGPNGMRYKVVSCATSFHGRSFGTMVATGQPKVRAGYDPFLPGFVNVAFNDLGAIERAIDPETVALIVEPIQGEGGV